MAVFNLHLSCQLRNLNIHSNDCGLDFNQLAQSPTVDIGENLKISLIPKTKFIPTLD